MEVVTIYFGERIKRTKKSLVKNSAIFVILSSLMENEADHVDRDLYTFDSWNCLV